MAYINAKHRSIFGARSPVMVDKNREKMNHVAHRANCILQKPFPIRVCIDLVGEQVHC
jgi:hypothetical protein